MWILMLRICFIDPIEFCTVSEVDQHNITYSILRVSFVCLKPWPKDKNSLLQYATAERDCMAFPVWQTVFFVSVGYRIHNTCPRTFRAALISGLTIIRHSGLRYVVITEPMLSDKRDPRWLEINNPQPQPCLFNHKPRHLSARPDTERSIAEPSSGHDGLITALAVPSCWVLPSGRIRLLPRRHDSIASRRQVVGAKCSGKVGNVSVIPGHTCTVWYWY